MTLEEFLQKDTALRHAIQTGTKIEYERKGYYDRYPKDLIDILKHIRTGLNCTMVEHATIIQLLKKKNLINEEDYFNEALSMLAKEVKSMEDSLDPAGKMHLG